MPSGTWLVAEDDFGGDSSSKYGPKAHPYQLDQDDSDSDEDEDGEKPDEADLKDNWGRDDVTDEDGYESTDSEAESDMGEKTTNMHKFDKNLDLITLDEF